MSKMARIATAVVVLALVPGTIAGQERVVPVEGTWLAFAPSVKVGIEHDFGVGGSIGMMVGCDLAGGPYLELILYGPLVSDGFDRPVNYVFEWESGERNTYTARVLSVLEVEIMSATFTVGDTRKMIPKLISEQWVRTRLETVTDRTQWSLNGSSAAINSLHCVGH